MKINFKHFSGFEIERVFFTADYAEIVLPGHESENDIFTVYGRLVENNEAVALLDLDSKECAESVLKQFYLMID